MAQNNKYTSSFTVNVTGEITEENFAGKFTVKTRLSHRDNLVRDNRRRELLGEANPAFAEGRMASTAYVCSQLSVRIIEAPSWWTESNDGTDLIDEEVLLAVYYKAMEVDEVEQKTLAKKAKAEAEKLAASVDKTSDDE